ncbi:MAG: alpha/beta fold hydrolase [Anaerolineae bacterium]|nr:alpha/beta fold hydrolase [Anaerolineae bacterium]
MKTSIIPSAEPFFFPGTSTVSAGATQTTGILLTHGFTGAPKEMRWMGEYLAQLGYPCLGVRLAGHATCPEDMIRSRHEDWLASVEDGYHLLRGVCEQVMLVGLSMGGVLSLISATRLPVKGVIAMATPYGLPKDWRLEQTELLSRFIPYMPKSKDAPGSGWFDKAAWQEHVSYPQNPLRSIGELKKLLALSRASLPDVQVPTLLIYSQDDKYLPLGSLNSMEYIYSHIRSDRKEKLVISGSGHVIPRDAQRGQVFEAAAQFIRSLAE